MSPVVAADAPARAADDGAPVARRPGSARSLAAAVSTPWRCVLRQADESLRTLGRFFELAAQSAGYLITDLVRLRHPWRETLNQASFIVGVTAIPALLISVPFGVIVAVQVGSVIQQVGATSISGAAGGLGVIRQAAPIVAALLLGGAAGAAITTDLGARSIRDEVDALRVMGIDPVQRLVTPRLAAIIVVSPPLCVFIVFMGLAAGYVINVGFQSGTPGSYIASFGSFATIADVVVALLKTWLFGVLVTLIACQRGLEAKGGPRGVADGVNAAVVLGVVTVFVLNLVITEFVTLFMPAKVG
ncbi:ABC transporter permease [Mycobacterium shinjukuense]|uniref:Putative YrbE family protein n=1 Tax=Mycobacterium shinjukuense TaxID=398694 RepID=A0A7I7MVR4_9MYCO|nr:ABC transporter permease [Mycobacterium shinjukuense]BBX75952.1 putative YrbE family protein [Mycobacterium shinjukuense]